MEANWQDLMQQPTLNEKKLQCCRPEAGGDLEPEPKLSV